MRAGGIPKKAHSNEALTVRDPDVAGRFGTRLECFRIRLGRSTDGTLDSMTRTRAPRPKAGFLRDHGLSLTAISILLSWVALYRYSDPKTHSGSFFDNAIADWMGVVVTV